jgi:hypothetical protein
LSAQIYLVRKVATLDDMEIIADRNGTPNDIDADVAVGMTRECGELSGAEIEAIKRAGCSDADTAEIIADGALNVLADMISKALGTDHDFANRPNSARSCLSQHPRKTRIGDSHRNRAWLPRQARDR